MTLPRHHLKLPSFAPLLASHEELQQAIQARNLHKRLQKLIRHPLRTVVNHLAGQRLPVFQPDFIGYSAWPDDVRLELQKLPSDFITSYSLKPDSAHWLYELVKSNDFECIIECGCGISSVIIALAIGRRPIRFLSLEHDAHWLQSTCSALTNVELDHRVTVVHAPLYTMSFAKCEFKAHSPEQLLKMEADLLLIDAPPSSVGRTGVLPALATRLASGACVILDDAARCPEAESVRMWQKEGLLKKPKFVALGTGLAVAHRC